MTLRLLTTIVSLCLWLVPTGGTSADVPTILPLGDSLTAGWNQPSYRMPLSRALTSRGCEIDFVGNQTLTSRTPHAPEKFPGLHFPSFSEDTHPGYDANEHWDPALGDDTDHAGYPGAGAAELLKRTWVEVRLGQPDFVLLHVGTNDVMAALGVQTKEDSVQFAIATVSKINEIIMAIYSSHKSPQSVQILLANMVPNDPTERIKESVNELKLSGILSRYIAALVEGKNDPRLMLVDVATGFNVDTMTTDGIHPNVHGELHIAQAFESALLDAGLCKA